MGVDMDLRVRGSRLRWSGLVVAAVGFGISRVTVGASVTMNDSLAMFLLTSAVPMAAAFGLVAFGIGLTVSSLSPTYVRTVALWAVLGTVGMGLTAVVAALDTGTAMGGLFDATTGSYATNAVLGGAVGGTLTGVYAARAGRHTRAMARQSDRLHLLNRLLRDEIRNAVTVVLGHADILAGREDDDHGEPIRRNAEHIQSVVDDVGDLTETSGTFESVTVGPVLDTVVAEQRAAHPESRISVSGETDAVVRADDQLELLFEQVVSNAVEHNPAAEPSVEVRVTRGDTAVEITVSDDGPGLAESEQALLTAGSLDRYDRPSEGFGLWIARVLLDRYGGEAGVTIADGTSVTMSLPRADVESVRRQQSRAGAVAPRTLALATVSGLFAGVGMGLTLQLFSNTLPVIGALYGTASLAVGWVTHLFHSVVFAVVFATTLSHPRFAGVLDRPGKTTALAVGFGTSLWLVAAGLVMPLWLRVVGVDVGVPRLQAVPLVGHLLWAGLLGSSYWLLCRVDADS